MENIRDLNASLDMAEAAERAKNEFTFFVKNANSGAKIEFFASGENWLIQVFDATAEKLGLNPDYQKDKPFFSNDAGKTTSDSEMSLSEFGIKEGSILSIHQNDGVAAN